MKNNEIRETVDAWLFVFGGLSFLSVGYVCCHTEYFIYPVPVMIMLALGFAFVFTMATLAVTVIMAVCKRLYRKAKRSIRRSKRQARAVSRSYGTH